MSGLAEKQAQERRRDLPYLIAALAICAVIPMFWGYPLVVVVLAMIASTLLGRIRIRRFSSNLWIRRCSPALPYICALGAPINWGGSQHPVFWIVGLSVSILVHVMRRKSLAIAFNRHLLKMLHRESAADRYSESAYYLLPAFMQEMLFRGILITALFALGLHPILILAISASLFVLDHLFTNNWHVKATPANLLTWFGPGLVWATIVVLGGSIWIPIASHFLLNLPAALLPHLRGVEGRKADKMLNSNSKSLPGELDYS